MKDIYQIVTDSSLIYIFYTENIKLWIKESSKGTI